MAWNYRKRVKIAPGIHLNYSKNGVSTSIGPKGAKITFGKNGTYLNTSIPGTGLYNRQKISGGTSMNNNVNGMFWWYIKYIIICSAFTFVSIYFFVNPKGEISIIIGSIFLAAALLGFYFLYRIYNKLQDNDNEVIEEISNTANIVSIDITEDEQKIITKKYDTLFIEAVTYVIQNESVSTTTIQKHFSIGLNRATRLMEQLVETGIISSGNKGYRESHNVLIHNNREWQITKKQILENLSKSAPEHEKKNEEMIEHENFEISLYISEDMFNLVKSASDNLCNFVSKIIEMKAVRDKLDKTLRIVGLKDEKNRFSPMIIVAADIYRCYKGLGHDFATDDEGDLGVLLFMTKYMEPNTIVDFKNHMTLRNKIKPALTSYLESSLNVVDKIPDISSNEFVLQKILGECDKDLEIHYMTLLYRFTSALAKTDRQVNDIEAKWLSEIMESREIIIKNKGKKEYRTNQEHDSIETPYKKLDDLIGLSSVKGEVKGLANFIKIQQVRRNKGLKSPEISYHCVFTGNPGTGKTTVARIMASIYKNLGILKKGHLIETDRSGLVAEYVGQTAMKTNKIIDSALDGVLFIDEAYSLVQGGGNDYGHEAISTLLKRMEDDRNRLVVILAGYSSEMKEFIDSNPGLQSRFNRYIHFSDYTADELKEIFLVNAKKNQYSLDDEALATLDEMMHSAVEHKDKNFGNARFVRNIFEKSIQNQATRLASQPSITEDVLSTLKSVDIEINKL